MLTKEKLIAKRDAAKAVLEQMQRQFQSQLDTQAGYVQSLEESIVEWDRPDEVPAAKPTEEVAAAEIQG